MRREEINIRDPFVLTRNGQYYLYGTRGATCWGPADGFDVYVSRDLENWDGPFECFHNDGTFWADRNYWAPKCMNTMASCTCWRASSAKISAAARQF